jgi:SAM-dependent methyltransferase
MGNTEKFSGRAQDYTKGRPSYATEFIKMLRCDLKVNENTVVADIGSGTGKLSKQILDLGSKVFCVEPNKDMRKIAEKELSRYGNFVSVNGSSDFTTLDSNSVDVVTVAQAFHWFDVDKFKSECKRILKPNGKIILVWNTRDSNSVFNVESSEIYKKYCPNFKGYQGGMNDDDCRICELFDGDYKKVIFENPLEFTKEKFIMRSLSASYSIKNDDENYNEYIAELEKLFDKYSQNSIVIMPNNTVAYIGAIC